VLFHREGGKAPAHRLHGPAADLLPLRCGLINFDLQLTRSVRIVFPPCLVLLHIKVNQAILNLRDQSARFGCQHATFPD